MTRKLHLSTKGRTTLAYKCMLTGLVALIICGVYSTSAYAVGGIVCGTITNVMASGLARGIATIGVLIIGVGATLGRMQWTTAICVSVGIAGIYSASSLVFAFSGGAEAGCYGA